MNITNPLGTLSNSPDPIKEESKATSSSEPLSLQEQCNKKGIEVFNKLSESFATWYAVAPILAKKLPSKDFGLFLSCLESCISACERACEGSTDIQYQEKISDMKVKFEEIYEMMPLGPSVLLQRDLNRLARLAKIPENETYTNHLGTFYEPQISLFDLSMFFEKFIKKHGYAGVDIVMKTDKDSNHLPGNKMLTSIAFEYEEKTPSSFSFFSKKRKKSPRENQTKEIIDLITPQLSKWRFASFQVGHTDDIKDNLAKRGINVKKWGLFVEFEHIKVETNSNPNTLPEAKKVEELEGRLDQKRCHQNDSIIPLNSPTKKNIRFRIKTLLNKIISIFTNFFIKLKKCKLRHRTSSEN